MQRMKHQEHGAAMSSMGERLSRWAMGVCVALLVGLGMPGLALAQTVYYHNDTAGSPIVATDEAGNLLWRESYRPYGERMLKPAAANNQWFHGKQADPDTGMSDFGARNYDPVLGRFLSIDPVDFTEKNIHSFNRYNYGNNNPLKFKDPDGRAPEDLVDESRGAGRPTIGYQSIDGTMRMPSSRAEMLDAAKRLNGAQSAPQIARQEATEAAKGGTYVLKNAEGTIIKTGRTNNLARREAEHGRNHPDRTFEVDKRTDNRAAQRGREQDLHDANPSAHAANGGLDKINGISPKNPKRDEYLKAGRDLP